MKRLLTISFLLKIVMAFGQNDTIYFDQLSLKAIGKYSDEKEAGKWVYFFLNNQKQSEGEYNNGLPVGLWTNWYENGRVYTKGSYELGLKQGLWIVWDTLGRKIREEEFLHGKRTGASTEWNFKKGEKIIGQWDNDKLNGLTEWRALDTEKLILTAEFKNGVRDGWLRYYYPNGKIKSEGLFKNDREEGKHVWYTPDGRIEATARYQSGQLLK